MPQQQHTNQRTSNSDRNSVSRRSQGNQQPYRASLPQNHGQNTLNPVQSGQQNNQPSEDEAKKKYKSIKSHGKQYAIEISADTTQKEWSTIRIEAAAKLNNGTKAYDWNNKISVQMTKQELPVVIGTLLGYLPGCEYSQHGDTNKGFSIQNQQKTFYFKVFEGNSKRYMHCPVPIVEAHLMGMLALAEHTRNFEGVGSEAALTAIKTMCVQMYKHSAYPAPKSNQ